MADSRELFLSVATRQTGSAGRPPPGKNSSIACLIPRPSPCQVGCSFFKARTTKSVAGLIEQSVSRMRCRDSRHDQDTPGLRQHHGTVEKRCNVLVLNECEEAPEAPLAVSRPAPQVQFSDQPHKEALDRSCFRDTSGCAVFGIRTLENTQSSAKQDKRAQALC